MMYHNGKTLLEALNELAVEVNNLQVAYERNVVLDNVSWQVKRGTLAGIIGKMGVVNLRF